MLLLIVMSIVDTRASLTRTDTVKQLHFDFLCLLWVKTQLSMDVSYEQDFSYFYT